MPSCCATRRASSISDTEQQPGVSGPPSQRRMVAPTTSWPCSSNSAAAIDESTPPDIATRTLTGSRAPQLRDGLGDRLERELDVGLGARPAERQPKRAQRPRAVD